MDILSLAVNALFALEFGWSDVKQNQNSSQIPEYFNL